MAEADPEREERPRGQALTVRVHVLHRPQVLDDPPHPRRILGEAGEEVGVALGHPAGQHLVHRIRLVKDGGEAPGDDHPGHVLGKEGEVSEAAEATEALPEEMPAGILAEQHRAESLGIAHDGVGAEVGEVVGQLRRTRARQRTPLERRAQTGAALVEQEHPVPRQELLEPGAASGREGELHPRPTLVPADHRQTGIVRLLRGHHLAGKDADGRRLAGPGPIEGALDAVPGDDHAVDGRPRDDLVRAHRSFPGATTVMLG